MKKIMAFLTASILFVITVFSVHLVAEDSLRTNDSHFGTWISTKKDLSYKAVSSNLKDNTYLMMGSSEFHHEKDAPYHPTQIFRALDMNVMCIGAAYSQSLTHAIALGSISQELKTKKVALLLSPSWFSKSGVKPAAFANRFSESQYIAMMKNPGISEETKWAVAKRTKELLEISPGLQEKAQRYERIFLSKRATLKDRVYYKLQKAFLDEKEAMNVGMLWKTTGKTEHASYETVNRQKLDWDVLAAEAAEGSTANPFYMDDEFYKNKVVPTMEKRKNADTNRSYGISPEYDDLKIFLDICRQEKIEVLLILLPVNGYWYDYTGFPKANRDLFEKNVLEIAKTYGVRTCNLFEECYTPGFLKDIVHPAEKGWIRINEAAYRFFRES